MLAGELIDRIQAELHDEAGARYTRDELRKYVELAQTEVSNVRPESCTFYRSRTLVAGCHQTLLDDEKYLLSVVHNLTDGVPTSSAIKIDPEMLAIFNPTWHQHPPVSSVEEWFVIDTTPKDFFVVPPVTAGTTVMLRVACVSQPLTDDYDPLILDDRYERSVTDFACYLALLKDELPDLAGQYLTRFYTALGIKPSEPDSVSSSG